MAGLFSRLKGGKEGNKKKNAAAQQSASDAPAKPKWDDAWTRTTVEPEEIHQLIRYCTEELKSRGMIAPRP